MSRPTDPPEEFLRRERLMGVRKGVSAARWTHLTPGPKCPELLDTPRIAPRLVQEIRVVEVDQLGPHEHADDPSERQEDPERNGLLARRGALARDDHAAYDAAGEEGDQERGNHRHTQL